MREIKFRAWYNNKEMLPVETMFFRYEIITVYLRRGDNVFGQGKCDAVVMQYTGLKDSTTWEELTLEEQNRWLENNTEEEWDGKEIYEGDIIEVWIEGYKQDDYYIVEDLRELYSEFERDDPYYRIQRAIVIGNKYENPELDI